MGNEGVDINWDVSPVSSPVTVVSDHTGSYTCEASNSIGNDTATAYVNILGTYHWMLREAICNDNF